MINDSTRESIYREVESRFPFPGWGRGASFGNSHLQPMARPVDRQQLGDLSALWQTEMQAVQEQVKDQILFQLHTLFEIPFPTSEIQVVVSEALAAIYALDRSCAGDGSYNAGQYARYLFRRCWQQDAPGYPPPNGVAPLLNGLRHVETARFFQRMPQEIASWTRRFLQVERYHRQDAVRTEQRLDRYRALQRGPTQAGPRSFDDLLIWLEFRLLAGPDGADADVAPLSHQLVEEIETGGWGEHFPGMPLQAVAYILLRCHQMCLSETIEFREQRRFQQMLATRQLATVLDLMRLVMHRTMGEPRLPEAAAMLDQLQEEGFNIEHQRFRDPYEAHLVSIADTERFERSRLPLFVSLDDVGGDLHPDLELSEKRLGEWHRRIVQEACRELVHYLQARRQPLPRAQLLHQLVRFATSWVLAQCPWPLSHPPDNLVEEVRQILPEHAVRHLVRPRKGYELTSKQALSALISERMPASAGGAPTDCSELKNSGAA